MARKIDDPRHTEGHSLSRRGWIRAGVLSALGLGLADGLRLRALARQDHGALGRSAQPRARSCILVWLAGGPSHIDTFDPKPDAGTDYRGEFQPIATAIPGVQISEILPRLARALDRACLIRSMTSPEADHDRATHHMLTGYRPSPALVYPSLGSVVSRLSRTDLTILPEYVAVPAAPLFATSGYLTPAYDPFVVGGDPNAQGFRVRDLTPPDRLTLDRLQRRRRMIQSLDDFSGQVPDTALTQSRDQFIGRAYDLLTSNQAQAAFQIERESDATRERYGRNPLGQACLLARRLVEAGVSFVTVNDQGQGGLGWDTHAQNFTALKTNLAPPFDQGLAALLDDLAARGLLEETLVVVMGEFGRTPRINPQAGRDHHGRSSCVLLAGAGMPAGRVLGSSDRNADAPVDRPVTPSDLAATVLERLGIDPTQKIVSPEGQPIRLVDTGQPIAELAVSA
jgi:hypothetical protein